MSGQRLVLPPAQPGSPAAPSIQFIGTATVILRHAGFTLLTDPNFIHAGDHVHLGYGLTSRRLTDPAIDFEALPPFDLVLLSHLHEDHFDRLVAARLDRGTPIVTTPAAARSLRRMGFGATRGLGTWEPILVEKGAARLVLTATPGRHGPPVLASFLPDVMGTILDFPAPAGSDLRVYISGDTLVFEDLRRIPERFPDVDVALLHLGGTRLLGVLVTMDARQGVEAIRILDPRLTVPIHLDDYTVFTSGLGDFLEAADRAGLADRVRPLARGERLDLDLDALRGRRAAPPMRAHP